MDKVSFAPPQPSNLSSYIDTHFFGDRPHIRARRIPVAVIAHNATDHQLTVAQLAHEFSLSEKEVLAALLYYEENKQLIEAQEAAEQSQKDETYYIHNPEA